MEVDLLSEVVQNELFQVDEDISRGGFISSGFSVSETLDFFLLELTDEDPEEANETGRDHADSHSVDKEIKSGASSFDLMELMYLHALSRPCSCGEGGHILFLVLNLLFTLSIKKTSSRSYTVFDEV